MDEQMWNALQALLAQAPTVYQRLCVGCWVKTHKTPFPSQASSSLCPNCALLTRQSRAAAKAREQETRWAV